MNKALLAKLAEMAPKPPEPPKPPECLAVQPAKHTDPGPEYRPRARPTTLPVFDLDLRVLYQDVESRPEHYSEEQLRCIELARRGKASEITERQAIDLMITLMRPTSLRKASAEIMQRVQAKAEEDKPPEPKATFEDQSFGPSIVIA